MKKYLFFLVLLSVVTSCDYILKKKENKARVEIDSVPELGIAIVKDKNGKVKARWVKIKKLLTRSFFIQ